MKNKNPDVTRQDLLNVKVGTTVTFSLSHPKNIKSVRSIASDINNTEERTTILSCSKVEGDCRKVEVTAIKKK